MHRRTFLSSITLALFAAPLAVEAQPAGKPYRIGYLAGGSATVNPNFAEAFRQGLRELGRVEKENIAIEYRFAEGRLDRLPDLAAQLVRLKVDIIVATPTPAAVAARNATQDDPYRHAGGWRSRRARARPEPRASGREHHGALLHRGHGNDRQGARTAHGSRPHP